MSTFWGLDFDALAATDPEIAGVVLGELGRVRGGLQLIASENLTSPAVLAALGSTLTNKYAEGYPGRRYYGGCAIPCDPQRPMIAGGIRVGTPSVTTQGMGEPEMRQIAALIARAVRADPDTAEGAATLADVGDEVAALVAKLPAYPR